MQIDDNTMYAVGTILGPILGWLGYKKITRTERVADAAAAMDESALDAYKTVIDRMVVETQRLAENNESLRAEVALLREQIYKFRENEMQLRLQIETLQSTVEELTSALAKKCACCADNGCEGMGDPT